MIDDQLHYRSDLAESVLYLEGNKFSLSDGYNLYRAIYDIYAPTILLKNARQTGKTLTVANFIALDSTTTPFIKSFYLSPSQSQTTRFSHTKLMKVISRSPLIKQNFLGAGVNNVFLKVGRNGAEVTLSYANDDPDRTRGVTSDRNYYDECQDMDLPEIMSVADSCMDASQDPRKYISGTPKSIENPLEELWTMSSQTEPLIRCHSCKIWNKPGEKNIGKKGFICAKCGRILNVRDFAWKDFKKDYRIKGFHIPQIVIPSHTEHPIKWDLLVEKYETYAPAKFKNEILAESDSTGSRLLSKEEMVACCQPYTMSRTPTPDLTRGVDIITAGVDWSGGGKGGVSRTVIHIWGVTPDLKFKTLFYKIYPTEDPVNSIEDIVSLCTIFGVRLVIGDQGEGSLANGLLVAKYGQHRVGKFRYGSYSKPIDLDPVTGVYNLDKTTIIDNYFNFIKQKGTIFPREDDCRVAFDDVLNEFSEITHTGKKIWKHGLLRPDDCLHAQIAGWIAGKLLKRDLSFY